MKQTIINISLVAAFALLIGLGQSVLAQSPWTAPPSSFPNDNVDEPLNKGMDDQTKTGSITAWKLFSTLTKSDKVRGTNVVSADQNGQGFCFGSLVNGEWDYTAGGCVNDWADLGGGDTTVVEGIDPGNINETLRFDGAAWVSNGLLKNDGTTVTIDRIGPYSNPNGEGFPGQSGFLGVKKAFAQSSNDFTPIFQVRSGFENSQGGTGILNGLYVLGNGITWSRGGFFSEGPANFWNTVSVGGNLTATGGLTVNSNAVFNNGVKITSGNPGEGRVLTSDAQGNVSWEEVDTSVNISTRLNPQSNSGDGNNPGVTATAGCGTGEILVSGGGSCSADRGYIRTNRPINNGATWEVTCGRPLGTTGNHTTYAYAVCMSVGTGGQQPNPNPSQYEWEQAPAVQGVQGQSCQNLLQSVGINISAQDIATKSPHPGGAQPQGYNQLPAGYEVGKCLYITPTGQGLEVDADLRDFTYTNANSSPTVNGQYFNPGITYIRN